MGDTVFAPMAIYPGKTKSTDNLKENSIIAVPNDVTNLGRALILLQDAGIIKLKNESGLLPTTKDIVENSKNISIKEVAATQITSAIKDVDLAVINSGVAINFNISPKEDSIFIENESSDTIKPYINIIASRTKDKDNETYKKVVKAYQSEDTKDKINKVYKGALYLFLIQTKQPLGTINTLFILFVVINKIM